MLWDGALKGIYFQHMSLLVYSSWVYTFSILILFKSLVIFTLVGLLWLYCE
jgi:hypothetical protein